MSRFHWGKSSIRSSGTTSRRKRACGRSIKSYRDTLRLFLIFAARDAGRRIARLSPEHLTFERVVGFLRH